MKSLLPPELQASWSVRDAVSREERFKELAFAGCRIPRCGKFKDMVRLGVPLVVYTDEFAHCGEGKVLFKHGGFVPEWSGDTFCSEYKPDALSTERSALSRRHLFVGGWLFGLHYKSSSSWMSNVDGGFLVLSKTKVNRGLSTIRYPMFSIDYTVDQAGDPFHFDLNTCPGVPLEVVNMVGRDVLTESVREVCVEIGLVK